MGWFTQQQKSTRTKSVTRFRPRVEGLEERATPAAMNAYETYALQIINQLRANPGAFAADLKQLYLGGTYRSPTGVRADDPVWTDLRAEINFAQANGFWRSGFSGGGTNTFMIVASALRPQAPLAFD